jgi:predicted alpha/beta superfamily hydrolase
VEETVRASTVSGHVERLAGVWSPQLANRRDVLVWLPPDQGRARKRCPVVYMQDGQNVFDASTSFSGREWQADETAAHLAARGLPLIVVAVANTGEARMSEYSPFVAERLRSRGLADRYVSFLADTLKPLIDARYRTDPAPRRTAVVGSSLGALVSLHALYTRPDAFRLGGILSPSLWFADRAMLRVVQERRPPRGLRVWVDMGTLEGSTPQAQRNGVADARQLAALLEERKVAVRLKIARGGRHHEDAWAARLGEALLWLYQEMD